MELLEGESGLAMTRRLAACVAVLSLVQIGGVAAEAEENRTTRRRGPEAARHLVAIAQEQYLQERWLDSGESFLAAYDMVPLAALLFNAGVAFRRGGACDRSLECFRRYLHGEEEIRRDAAVRSALGSSTVESGEADQCRDAERLHRTISEADRRAARDRTAEARRLMSIAQEYYLQERWSEAAEMFEAAHAARPHRAFLWNLGMCYLRAAEWLESQLAFEHYLAESPAEIRRHPAVAAAVAALDAEPYVEDTRARSLLGNLSSAIVRAERDHRGSSEVR